MKRSFRKSRKGRKGRKGRKSHKKHFGRMSIRKLLSKAKSNKIGPDNFVDKNDSKKPYVAPDIDYNEHYNNIFMKKEEPINYNEHYNKIFGQKNPINYTEHYNKIFGQKK